MASHDQIPTDIILDSRLYLPLDEGKDEIRLITLLPPSAGSPLHCKLMTVSLDSYSPEYQEFISKRDSTRTKKQQIIDDWLSWLANFGISDKVAHQKQARFTWGDYAALSYVWGDPKETSRIFINGRETEITKNLEVVLQELSGDPAFVYGYKLWVDAICINQHDLDERGRQVRKMQKIYSNAWSVQAWLGEEKNGSSSAITLVRNLSYMALYAKDEELQARLQRSPGHLGPQGCWLAFSAFMQRPYWKRLWIAQEVVLGGSSVIIRCGSQSIDWPVFYAGIQFLFEYLWTVKDLLLRHEMDACGILTGSRRWRTKSLHLVKLLWDLGQNRERGSDYEKLNLLLGIAGPSLVTDPRDKAYGLVGIMSPEVALQLVPDYRLPPSKVFAVMANTLISVGGNLEPLREGNPWSETGTPSWAADWCWKGRIRGSRIGSHLTAPHLQPKFQKSELLHPYEASGNISMEVLFSPDNTKLTCKGFLVDKVSGLGAQGDGYYKWDRGTVIQPESEKNAYGDISGFAEALCHTLVADRVGHRDKLTSECDKAILSLPSRFETLYSRCQTLGWEWLCTQKGYYFRWEQWRMANSDFILGGQRLDDYFSDFIPANASELDYNEVYSYYRRACKDRRLMITSEGYVGWSPDNIHGTSREQTRKGDLIAIIFGCSTPILLRPHGEYFEVVGEAYVHGLMNGEAMSFLQSGACQLRDFTLC